MGDNLMTSLLMKEIHNLQEVIEECLDDIPIDDPKVETLKDKYYQSLGMLQKSLHTDFYMGKVLAYKEMLGLFEGKDDYYHGGRDSEFL